MAQWIAKFEDVACNGDVIIRTAKGRLVAIIYAVNAKSEDPATMKRAQVFIIAAQPSWCETCGRDTDGANECAACTLFWAKASNDPAISQSASCTQVHA